MGAGAGKPSCKYLSRICRKDNIYISICLIILTLLNVLFVAEDLLPSNIVAILPLKHESRLHQKTYFATSSQIFVNKIRYDIS